MLNPKSANQNLAKFLGLALPEKAGLGEPISACLFSARYLAQLQDFSLLHVRMVTLIESISRCPT